MITDRDILKLKEVFGTKEDLLEVKIDVTIIKDDFGRLEDKVDKLDLRFDQVFNLLSGLATKFDKFGLEYAALKVSDDRQNNQLKHLAREINTKLPE